VANKLLPGGVGEDPITIFTLLSELQREAEQWKKEAKKYEEKAI
jgi:hypothetical protein